MKTSALRVIALLMLPGLCSAATFTPLEAVSGDSFTLARGISDDGGVVVGVSGNASSNEAVRWTSGVITGLGSLPGQPDSEAVDVSADGTVIVGLASSTNGGSREAFRWTGDVMTGLGVLPGGFTSQAFDVSADGTVVVGWADDYWGGVQAFRWTDDVMTGLGALPAATNSVARGVSADGAVIVGASYEGGIPEAFRWTGGVMAGLGALPGDSESFAFGVSADGTVVVGHSGDGTNFEAFRWTDGLMTGLGLLPGSPSSTAEDVSADGAVVVGQSGGEAFIWTESNGMKRLVDVLAAGGATGLSGWTLEEATGISADGQWVVGNGTLGAFLASFSSADLNIVPDRFSFLDQSGVAVSAQITSAPVTITGILAAAPVTVTGGQYSIGCGAVFTDAPGTISNNQTVCVQQTSAMANATGTNTTLTIGGVANTFTSTTIAASGGGGGGGGGSALDGLSLLGLGLIGVIRRRRLAD